MHKENNSKLVRAQALHVTSKYEGLEFVEEDNGSFLLKGVLAFEGEYEGLVVADAFDIEMLIPSNYPKALPVVRETGYRIPRQFHINLDDNTLCLAAPLAVKIQFSLDKTLLGFIENLIIPFFFNYIQFQKSGILPFGELSHGAEGVLEFYKDYFDCNNSETVLKLLRILIMQDYRGFSKCPCNSGRNLRNCHGRQLIKCMNLQTPQEFANERWAIYEFLRRK